MLNSTSACQLLSHHKTSVQAYESCCGKQDFGQKLDHIIDFSLTGIQASAVDAAKYSYKSFEGGDIILVCDAGAGTTDLALLEQTTARGATPELRELTNITDLDIGSINMQDHGSFRLLYFLFKYPTL